MSIEYWKDIPGYENLYQASNLGRIRSLDRVVRHNYGGTAIKKGRILKPHISSSYIGSKHRWQARLSKNGRVCFPVWARCIWEAFNGPIPDGMQCNHIDEDPTNNRLDNINLMTPKENTNWGTGIERRAKTCSKSMIGKKTYSKNPNSKMVMEYDKNGVPFMLWFSLKAAAEYHNCHYSSIWKNIVGKNANSSGISFKYYTKTEAD